MLEREHRFKNLSRSNAGNAADAKSGLVATAINPSKFPKCQSFKIKAGYFEPMSQ